LLTVFSFLLLGSFPYFNNIVYFHDPLGPSEAVNADSFGSASFGDKLKYNVPRYLYQFISFDSLPVPWGQKAIELKSQVFSGIDGMLLLNLESAVAVKDPSQLFSYTAPPKFNEDEAWFGFACALAIFPTVVIGLIKGIKGKSFYVIALLILGISFSICEILLRPGWHPFEGRYYSLMVAVLSPLTVFLFTQRNFSRIYIVIVSLIALVTLFFAVFSNQSKPVLGKIYFDSKYIQLENAYKPGGPVLDGIRKIPLKFYSLMYYSFPFVKSIADYDDVELRTLSFQEHHTKIVYSVNQIVPEDGRMGIMLVNQDFDYVFFGSKLTRVLVNINPDDRLFDKKWIEDQKLPYILISHYKRFPILPDFLDLKVSVDGWGLFKVNFP
jgi:hypothetical protein